MDENECCEATPHEQLIAEIMDCNIPKNEMGWAAAREIGKLRERTKELEFRIKHIREIYDSNMQAARKAALVEAMKEAEKRGAVTTADAIRALKQ